MIRNADLDYVPERLCALCGGHRLVVLRRGILPRALEAEDFAITDTRYGVTGTIYECRRCGFVQCADFANVADFYTALQDSDYEASRPQRLLQAEKLLEAISRMTGRPLEGASLLDVGAASGILLEAANARGVVSVGIEPSEWLVDQGLKRGLNVHCGTLPHVDIHQMFDFVTIVDVIEHVENPMDLVRTSTARLRDDGWLVVVTPDVRSLAARLAGRRWWHYRVAHIGYFSRSTLQWVLGQNGLQVFTWSRPGWFFSAQYLLDRLCAYLPGHPRLRLPQRFAGAIVPLNLFDSWLVIARKQEALQSATLS